VLLLAGAGGFATYRLLLARHPSITVEPRGAVAPAPSRAAETPPAPKIPEQLPDVALPDASGKPHRLSEWKGRLLVLNFWATWCEPCQREIPLLKKLREQRAREGFEVVGIAVDLRSAVVNYARSHGIDYPLLIGEKDGLTAVTALGMDTVFPFTVFADRNGRIITLKVGELYSEEASFILDSVRDLDQGRLTLEAAREQIKAGISAMAAKRARAQEPAQGAEAQGSR
jgi:thiol-disulfide isomerase/thioredoxin